VVKVAEAELNVASAEMRAWLDGLGVESAGSREAHLLLAEERRKRHLGRHQTSGHGYRPPLSSPGRLFLLP